MNSTEILDLSGRTPMPQDGYDNHLRASEVFPALNRWGFEARFRTLQTLNNGQVRVLEKVKEKMVGVGAIVALVGIRGTGKTTIAAQFAYEKAWKNSQEARRTDSGPREIVTVSYRKATGILSRFKPLYSDFGSLDTETLTDARNYYCRVTEFAVIDELHECEEQKLRNRILSDVLDRRYAAKRDTLIISNQTPEDFEATMSDSIISRLSEHGQIIPCMWESFR